MHLEGSQSVIFENLISEPNTFFIQIISGIFPTQAIIDDPGKLSAKMSAVLTPGGITRGAAGRKQRILSPSESEFSLTKGARNPYGLFLNRRTRRKRICQKSLRSSLQPRLAQGVHDAVPSWPFLPWDIFGVPY